MAATRELDIVLLGATGFRGALCAEHIMRTFPTTLKWAIAGRSAAALERLSERLISINTDLIEIVELNAIDLDRLTAKARVVINTIGPFCRFSTPILKACAKNGTHYFDTTTETLWIKEIIEKYHSTAVETGAKIIPSISLSSSPSDLLAWLSVNKIREQSVSGVSQVIASGKLEISGMSAGSLASVLDVRDKYGPDLQKSRENESVEFKAIATSEDGKMRVGSRWAYKGSMYELRLVEILEPNFNDPATKNDDILIDFREGNYAFCEPYLGQDSRSIGGTFQTLVSHHRQSGTGKDHSETANGFALQFRQKNDICDRAPEA
ncbi:uncharacterized protein LY89DRAFT_733076 [Mollisia scopiformis]|uniref:Saccharopine dehydrogenase NADP binding domain-containing protein n=1 Tax=Mollisia scopiformis TaxID=149040 RepID=A0A194XE27_MOLSC|nr:uncharacterized protein LY89DRAFT_733076 [Mollisia scopiformis]KUJ18406.1 hypothetical protein LY89DRAFT_733076 [Mollisia scopiformis]